MTQWPLPERSSRISDEDHDAEEDRYDALTLEGVNQ